MATRSRAHTSSRGSSKQAQLERAAGDMRKDAVEMAQSGADSMEAAAGGLAVAEVLDSAGLIAFGAGIQDLTRAEDLQTVASRVGTLSEVVAASGVADVAQGAEMLVAAEDVATVSAVVGVMSLTDLDRGMELARISGELQAAGSLVEKLKMPLLAAFLGDRSGKVSQIAVESIMLASANRALAAATAVTGKQLTELSANEVAEGIVRLAASEALAEGSKAMAEESGNLAATGRDEVVMADQLDTAAGQIRADAVDAGARGAASLGAAVAEAAMADALTEEKDK